MILNSAHFLPWNYHASNNGEDCVVIGGRKVYSKDMNSVEISEALAAPIQDIGMQYYFDAGTGERATPLGLNQFQFYGLGRGGVLGNVDAATVTDVFYFFHRRSIDFLYGSGLSVCEPTVAAAAHLEAAYAYGDAKFASIDESVHQAFVDAVGAVIAGVPKGLYPIFDGYRAFFPADTLRHSSYLGTILLRELRGGVHTEAVKELGLTGAEACFVGVEGIFAMHGYNEADTPNDVERIASLKEQAEVMTTAAEAAYFAVLSDSQRDDLLAATTAMAELLRN